MRFTWMIVHVMVAAFGSSLPAEESRLDDVSDELTHQLDYQRDVAPLFTKNCVACHNAKKAEGGLNLESHSAMMIGGDSGAAVEPGDIDSGTLLARIIDDDDPMPPDGNSVGAQRLNQGQVALLRQWVQAGALSPEETIREPMRWQSLPESVHPVYALAASPDGNYVAFGRGNQAFIMRQNALESNLHAFELADSSVQETLGRSSGVTTPQSAAHLDIVQSVAFSPDSQLLATGGYRDVKLWRRKTQPLFRLASAISINAAPTFAALSHNASRLAAAHGTQLEIVHLNSGKATRLLKSHADEIIALAWLKDSEMLLSIDSGGGFVLTDGLSLQSSPMRLRGPEQSSAESAGHTLGESSDEDSENPKPSFRKLAAIAENRLIAVDESGLMWELTLDVLQLIVTTRVVEPFSQVTAIAVNASGRNSIENRAEDHSTYGRAAQLIAVGQPSGVCLIVNCEGFETVKELTFNEPIVELALSPSGNLVATSDGLSPAKLWRVEDGTCITTFDRDYHYTQQVATAQRDTMRQQGHLDRLAARLAELTKAAEAEEAARAKVQESRDKAAEELAAKEAALSGANEAVVQAEKAMVEAEAAVAEAMKLVETRKAELEAKRQAGDEAKTQKDKAATELASREQALATAVDATHRAAQRIPETQQIISDETQTLETLQQSQQILVDQPQTPTALRRIAIHFDESKAIIVDQNGRQHVFSTTDGRPEAILQADSRVADSWSLPDGSLIALTELGTAIKWDLSFPWELYRTIGSFEDSPWSDRITALDFSPDGSQLAVGSGVPSRSGEIKTIGVETGNVVLDLGEAHSDTVFAIRFSPNGQILASAAADKQCRLFDSSTGRPLGVLEGHTHHVLSLAWKDDCVTLATGSADASVKLWNVESGTQMRTVGGFKKEVTSLEFVAQSDQFVATDATGSIQLISAGDGKQIRTFSGADGGVHAISISPDGKLVFAGGQTGNNWAWQIEDGKQIR